MAMKYKIKITFGWIVLNGESFIRYTTHRPPTVVDVYGTNLREIKAIIAASLANKSIFMYHYELLFSK